MGAIGPNNFFGAKNYTLCTWWWRLASDWELVIAGYGTVPVQLRRLRYKGMSARMHLI